MTSPNSVKKRCQQLHASDVRGLVAAKNYFKPLVKKLKFSTLVPKSDLGLKFTKNGRKIIHHEPVHIGQVNLILGIGISTPRMRFYYPTCTLMMNCYIPHPHTTTTNNGTQHLKSLKSQNRRAILGRPAIKLLGGGGGGGGGFN